MKSLEEEANLVCNNPDLSWENEYARNSFIAGANSKYVQAQIIREKMSLLSEMRMYVEDSYYIDKEYDKLYEQLKQLENEE